MITSAQEEKYKTFMALKNLQFCLKSDKDSMKEIKTSMDSTIKHISKEDTEGYEPWYYGYIVGIEGEISGFLETTKEINELLLAIDDNLAKKLNDLREGLIKLGDPRVSRDS